MPGRVRATLAACLAMNGAGAGKAVIKPAKRASRAGAAVDAQSVLVYIKSNPETSGEQVARETGTDTATLHPVLHDCP